METVDLLIQKGTDINKADKVSLYRHCNYIIRACSFQNSLSHIYVWYLIKLQNCEWQKWKLNYIYGVHLNTYTLVLVVSNIIGVVLNVPKVYIYVIAKCSWIEISSIVQRRNEFGASISVLSVCVSMCKSSIQKNTSRAATVCPDDKQDALEHDHTTKEKITSCTCKWYFLKVFIRSSNV